jgi:hypothetical protein
MKAGMTTVRVVGASGSIGRLAAAQASSTPPSTGTTCHSATSRHLSSPNSTP